MTQSTVSRIRWWNSFIFRFIFISIISIILLFGVLVYISHSGQREQVEQRVSSVLKTIVTNGAPLIDGGSLAAIKTNDDARSVAFRATRARLEGLRATNDLKEDAIYIFRPDESRSGRYRFVVMLQEQTFIGDEYTPPPQNHELYQRALLGAAVRSSIYEDAHGTFISGVAPIRDGAGKVVALLQADVRLADYMAQVDADSRRLILLSLVILGCIILLGLHMHRQLSHRIGELMKGTMALNNRDFAARVSLNTHDELAALGRSLNVALEHLQERAEMMRFLPDHTQKMIARVLEGGAEKIDLTEGREVDVAVLETDIRGFTALSERLTPTETIDLVNRYISVQAERVIEFGGSIDKYMGDAVLVVFEGEDAPKRALKCAQNILDEIKRMNEAVENPVWIGAGLSYGPVVMGNMGCEARMEHTIIGTTVNLAARLCSAARPGEVVVQGELIKRVAKDAGLGNALAGHETEFIEVKGFSEAVEICRL